MEYYITNCRAVQYDSKNNKFNSPWLNLFKSKNVLPSQEATDFFGKGIDLSDVLQKNTDELEDFWKQHNIADESLKNFLKTAGTGPKTLESYTSYLNNGTKSSQEFEKFTILAKNAALSLVSALASMAINWAIGAGINWVLTELVNKSETLSKRADELAAKSKKVADAAKDESDSINDLIARYKELANSETQDAGTRNEILSIQEQIVDAVGYHADGLDLVNGKLNEQLDKLNKISAVTAKTAKDTAMVAYNDAVDSSENAIGENSVLGRKGYEYTGKLDERVRDALGEYMGAFQKDANGKVSNTFAQMNLTYNEDYFKNILGIDISDAEGKIAAIEEMMKRIEGIAEFNESDDPLYNALIKARDYYSGYANKVEAGANNLLSATLTTVTSSEEILNARVKSVEDLDAYYNTIVEKMANDPALENALLNKDVSRDEIRNYVKDYISTLDEFSDYYYKWQDSLTQKAVDSTFESFKEKLLPHKDRFIRDPENPKRFIANPQWLETQEWIESLTEEDKRIIYQIECKYDTAEWGVEQFKEKIEETESAIEELNNIPLTGLSEWLNTESNSEKLEKVKSDIDTLRSAYEELGNADLTQSGLDTLLFELLQQFPQLAKYTDGTLESVERLREAIAQLGKTEATELVETLQNLANVEGITESARQELERFVDTLTSLSDISINIEMEDTKDVIRTMRRELEELAGLKKVISDENGTVLDFEEAKEYLDLFPELLQGAEMCADGTVKLNSDVANEFINSREAEIRADGEARITELENAKAIY